MAVKMGNVDLVFLPSRPEYECLYRACHVMTERGVYHEKGRHLQERGELVSFDKGMGSAAFVSHQWVGEPGSLNPCMYNVYLRIYICVWSVLGFLRWGLRRIETPHGPHPRRTAPTQTSDRCQSCRTQSGRALASFDAFGCFCSLLRNCLCIFVHIKPKRT